jgi:hypothetical protein
VDYFLLRNIFPENLKRRDQVFQRKTAVVKPIIQTARLPALREQRRSLWANPATVKSSMEIAMALRANPIGPDDNERVRHALAAVFSDAIARSRKG